MLTDLLRKSARIAWFLPGFLLWAAYPPMAERTDCLFALAPLLWFARRNESRESFKLWFENGLLYWVATLSWMPAIVKNGGPWPLVVLGWGALAAYCALFFGAFGWFSARAWAWVRDEGSPWRKPARHPYARRLCALLVIEPLLWAGLELLRCRLFGGFAWNPLGLPLVVAGLGLPASLGGVYLVSSLVVLVNGLIASVADRVWKPDPRFSRKIRWLESVLPLLLVALVYGVTFLAGFHLVKGYGALRVALVQRNFPCVFKPAEAEHPVTVYSNLLAQASCFRPELVVLPESALCEVGAIGSMQAQWFLQRLREWSGATAVLAGGARFAAGGEYNSAVLSYSGGKAVYDKVHLVPFGEFIPGDKLFPALQRFAPVGSCTPGALKLLPLNGPKLNFGCAICFEDTDSAQLRTLAAMGADVLAFITNDSWFSESIEAEQHAWQAVARAVETGLPVVRVGNSGVTGVIDPSGRATWLADAEGQPLVDARAIQCETVLVPNDCGWLSPYVKIGDLPLVVAFALLMMSMLLVKYRNDYEKRRYLSM